MAPVMPPAPPRSPLPDVDPADDAYQNLPAVLAGYGCGLPLSRMYARYFGGDLQIYSMQVGSGCTMHGTGPGGTRHYSYRLWPLRCLALNNELLHKLP